MALATLIRSRWQVLRHSGQLIRRHSWLKILVVGGFAAGIFISLGLLFYAGFDFLDRLGGVGIMVVQHLFSLFFFGLGVILTFSSMVTTYATLYRSPEVPMLITRPIPHGVIVLFKTLESALLSSWAFFLIIVPFIAAFAFHQGMTPLITLGTLIYSIPFVLFYSALGSLLCIVLARWMPSGRALMIMVLALGLVVVGLFLYAMWRPIETDDEASLVLSRLVPGMKISSHPMWPSRWVSEGIMSLSRGDMLRGAELGGLLLINVLAVGALVEGVGRRSFYDGWLKIIAGGRRSREAPASWNGLARCLVGAQPDSRALLMKDLRLFFRDPVQYTQALVFFGLLALYFVNLRHLNYHRLPDAWRNLIVFMNIFSVSAVVCSLSARFVYPQLSMEGHGLWITGMSGLSMRRILRAKYVFSATLLSTITLILVYLSSHMLGVDRLLLFTTGAIAVCVSMVVTAFSLGLGAVFMDLRERNPAVIISSFGGTLNLVLSIAYTATVIIGFGALFHARGRGALTDHRFVIAMEVAALGMILLTAACIYVPLRLGRRHLEHLGD